MKLALRLYHSLPSFVWPVVASARAYELKRRRYGDVYRAEIGAIRARTTWDRDRIDQYQRARLAEVLGRAAACVPAYRGNPPVREGDDALDVLRRWPILDAARFRARPEDYCDPEHARDGITLHTSGSTGTPKRIVRDARAEQLNYAYMEARWRNTAGVTAEDRWAIIGGQLVVPVERKRPPFWVAAYPMRQLYLSSYHLQREYARDYMAALRRWRPAYLLGYASSIDALADFAEQTGIRVPMKVVLSNAEPLLDHVRRKVERAFGCRAVDTYGCTEAIVHGFECAAGRMHVGPDFGVLEILRSDGSPCAPGEVGRVVATGLTNRAMPLVRYPVGDLASWAVDQRCTCGCSFPILAGIEGREDDVIVLRNGRRIGRLDPIFKGDLPIQEAQIVQRLSGDIEVRVVPRTGPGPGWRDAHGDALLADLRARVGEGVPVSLTLVPSIPRGANGKFKGVVRERAAP